jgi:hypothetical protein
MDLEVSPVLQYISTLEDERKWREELVLSFVRSTVLLEGAACEFFATDAMLAYEIRDDAGASLATPSTVVGGEVVLLFELERPLALKREGMLEPLRGLDIGRWKGPDDLRGLRS